MAYLPTNQRTSVQQEQDQNQGQPQALPSSSAGGGAAPAYGQPAAAAPTQARPSATYPMITDYLRANEGAGKTMAAGVAGQLGTEAANAQARNTQAQNDYQSQNGAAIDQWKQAVQSTQAANRAGYDTWSKQPIEFHQTGNGPWWTNAHDYVPTAVPMTPMVSPYSAPSDVLTADDRLASQIGALGTDSGREAMLRERYGNASGYTPGAAALDAAMVGRQNIDTAPYADILTALRSNPSGVDTSGVDTSDYGDTQHRKTIADVLKTL